MPAVRASSLQRALLVLLWVLLRRIIATYDVDDGNNNMNNSGGNSSSFQGDNAEGDPDSEMNNDSELTSALESVVQVLLYHAESLAEWLEVMIMIIRLLSKISPGACAISSHLFPPLTRTSRFLSLLAHFALFPYTESPH